MKYYHEEDSFALRGLEKEEFISRMIEWCNDDKATYYMVTGLYPGNREILEKQYQEIITGPNVVFAIVDKKTNKMFGAVGLYNINNQARFAELRIIIGETGSHGKGVGTAATKFTVKYAFEKLNLNKVWLGVNADNAGAVKCYENAGFIREGALRQEIFRNNRYYDAIRMSILRSDYEKNK